MTSAGYLRFPHIHDDLVTFVADDDVWLAPADGGRAWRVTADHAAASYPRISPDGTMIAWTSERDGPTEVYLTGIDGGSGRRLSYWGDDMTRVRGWTPGGDVLAVTAAGQPFELLTGAYALAAGDAAGDGRAAPQPLPLGIVADLAVTAEQTALLNGSRREPAHWKRYRGGTSGRLWLGPPLTRTGPAGPFTRVLADLAGQLACPMLIGGRLVFLSDHEGTGNLYSCALDGTGLRRHTDHDGWYVRNASTDGQRVVYHCAGDIWLLDGLDDATQPRRLEIALGSVTARSPRLISAEDHLGGLCCDRSGQASVIEVRGTVHWLTHRDGPARALSVVPGVHARLPRVLGDTGQVAWVTDAGGTDAIEVAASDGSADGAQPRRLAAGAIGQAAELSASPDGSSVAVAARDGRLLRVDASSGAVTELASSDNGEVTGLAWSPDSAWLAWSHPGPASLRQLRMTRPADPDRVVVDVTDGRFTDTDPVFTTDGKYLAFLSRRSFNPVYDAQVFDLSFPYGSRPYLVPLAAATPSPFGPLPAGRPFGRPARDGTGPDDPAGEGPASGSTASDGTGPESPGPDSTKSGVVHRVAVDSTGLAARVVPIPVPEGRYSSLRAVKGGVAWLREPVTGSLGESGASPGDAAPRPNLEYFDLAAQRCTELADELDWFQASGDGSALIVSDHGKLSVVPADRKPDPDNPADRVTVDKSRARFLADPAALWRNAYAEVGRLIQHDFWVPDIAEVDWEGVLGDYRPLLDRIAGSADFADLLWEVLGELGTSHAYVAPAASGPGAAGRDGLGLLGADLEQDDGGRWIVKRVLPGESSDPRARSPLTAPGTQITDGDVLLAVDGQPVAGPGPGPLLVGAAGKAVELTVTTAVGDGEPRRAVVTTLTSDRRLRYQAWVAGRRQLVRQLGGGQVGYLHVPNMVGEGWADFHRDLHAEMVQQALVIDLRGNRGGHTSQLVVEKLARRVIGWDVARNLRPDTYPMDAPRGPVVALADEFAGSDGDIVTAAIKILGLGPVVGVRTWGGVVGIDRFHELIDGTSITVPRYGMWLDGFGWDIENYGVDPDVEVLPTPDDHAAGRDPQLETAVTMALEALKTRPAVTAPDPATHASRRRPPLPPRNA